MPAGDTAGIGTGTAKKRPRRPSTGRNSARTRSSAEAGGDSDSEFSINSSDEDIRPTSTMSSCASTGRGALMTKQKASTRASASTTNKKRRANDEPGMTVSAVSRAIRGGQQQWTELTAVCHVFSDEVYKYMNPICVEEAEDSTSGTSKRRKKQPPHLSMGEKKHLNGRPLRPVCTHRWLRATGGAWRSSTARRRSRTKYRRGSPGCSPRGRSAKGRLGGWYAARAQTSP